MRFPDGLPARPAHASLAFAAALWLWSAGADQDEFVSSEGVFSEPPAPAAAPAPPPASDAAPAIPVAEVVGEEPGDSPRPGEESDPSKIWYRGFLLVQAAQDLEANGRLLEALNKLTEAKPIYDHLAQRFPEFQPDIVRERRRLIAEKREDLRTAMRAPQQPGASASPVAAAPAAPPPPIPGRTRIGGSEEAAPAPLHGSAPRTFEIEEEDGDFALPSWGEGSSRALPRVESGRSAPSVGAIASELHEDLARKDSLIAWLNEQNQRLRNELSQREDLLRHVNEELAGALANQEELQRRIREVESGPGSQEARRQIAQLRTLLSDATEQLEEATERNRRLVSDLHAAHAEMDRMRQRMTELERERDNLVEVVQGEGTGGTALKELMDRNRELSEQLDRAERLAASLAELNQEKDEDIALLRSEITRVKLERDQLAAENARHQQSIEELQRRLELLTDGLDTQEALGRLSSVERQENELLRSVVLKQLRRQAQMKQAKELLLAQLDRVGVRSETLLGLIEDMTRGSQLTEEEKALFRAPQIREMIEIATGPAASPAAAGDGENGDGGEDDTGAGASMAATLVAPGNAPPGEGGVVREKKLSVELAQLDKAARLDFLEGRYAEAEAGFLEYLRYRPRSVSCLCNLGILKIAMKNYSESEYYLSKAIAIDNASGLAHYLLGRTYFLQDRLDEALSQLEEGLSHDPQNAKAHNCVGVISSRKGWVARAEKAFTNAVSIDPEYGDAHFNLAVLFATREEPDPEAAEKHYFRALHLGVPRDAHIEDFLKESESLSVGMR